jgi:hypothetical protein
LTGLLSQPDQAERLMLALLSTLDSWIEQVESIADHAIPVTGNKKRALHLLRAMMQARITLHQMMDRSPD